MTNFSYDDGIFQSFRAISTELDESQWLGDHIRIAQEERELFINNEIENPKFAYKQQVPKPDYAQQLATLENDIKNSSTHAVVVELYQRKIEKQRVRNLLISASLDGRDADFYQLSTDLYGKPRQKYFSYVAKRLTDLADKTKGQHPVKSKQLKKLVSKISTDSVDIDVDILPPPVPADRLIRSISEVVEIFQQTLDRCGISGWSLEVDGTTRRTRFSVNPFKRVVYIPCEAQLLSRSKKLARIHVEALAEHEVGVHARRTYEATQGPLRLLEIGLDDHLPGEEGLAGYVQQQIEGADEFYGFDRYLAACLAIGLDGEKRDFRGVFVIMVDYYTLQFAADNNKEGQPFKAAWDVCVRIFRGTSGQSAGCIFTKDIVYMEGNIRMWLLLSEKPQVFESLFLGKFNPLLTRHVKALQTLEILKEW